ncbi:MAG TPA: hypothetical protein IAA59_13035 [Candidatus Faecaligallichristensenella faecipullorum]|nr:hypothetical protein [Candidatus Faecaligallichristensenella faecipullorum]
MKPTLTRILVLMLVLTLLLPGGVIAEEPPHQPLPEATLESATQPAPATAKPSEAPATAEPTEAPATAAPSSEVPATAEPTEAPATAEPTEVPATAAPTEVPATAEPSEVPATAAPSTEAPATAAPSEAPATAKPSGVPATAAPSARVPANSALMAANLMAEDCTHPNAAPSGKVYLECEYISITVESHTARAYVLQEYTCPDCNASWTGEKPAEKTEFTQRHDFLDATCACGYECQHPNLLHSQDVTGDTYSDGDETGHTHSFYLKDYYYCYRCSNEWYGETSDQLFSKREAHYYLDDGHCLDCGYISPAVASCTHPHKSVIRETFAGDAVYKDLGDSGHSVTGQKRQTWYCYACGDIWETTPAETYTKTQPHVIWENEPICDKCGHEPTCDHHNSYRKIHYTAPELAAADGDRGHYLTGATQEIYTVCNDCGYTRYEEVPGTDGFEEHTYINGFCYLCGYEPQCPHPNAAVDRTSVVWADSYENAGTEGHYLTGIIQTRYHCEDCDQSWYQTNSEPERILMPHDLFLGDCVCGYHVDCAHEHIDFSRSSPTSNPLLYTAYDENEHTCQEVFIYSEPMCLDCGEYFFTEEGMNRTHTFNEPHKFQDGKCVLCNYVYTEPEPTPTPAPAATPEPTAEPSPEPEITPVPEATPEPTAEPSPEPEITPVPEATTKPTAKPSPEPEKEDGQEDEPRPTATPAPQYTQLPQGEALHGLKVEDAPRLADVLSAVAQELAVSPEARVELIQAGKTVTPEERARLEALPLEEQVYTILSAIGLEDAVNRALDQGRIALSEEAAALKADMMARIAAMSAEERAGFEAMLQEAFSRQTILIDGVEHAFFTLELKITSGGEVRYERYGFCLEGEEWILTRLEVA